MEQIKRIDPNTISVKISVFVFEQDGLFVAYSPSLELSSYGKTKESATNSFEFVLEDFITYSVERKILRENLSDLGWELELNELKDELDYPNLILKSFNYEEVTPVGSIRHEHNGQIAYA